jgi:GNAT superfamily N-acetyltransferase
MTKPRSSNGCESRARLIDRKMQKRLATQKDVPVLAELRIKQLIDEGSSPILDISEQFAHYFSSSIADGTFIAWVMEDEGEIVATSGLCFFSLPPTFSDPSGKVAYITNMYTKPEYRRHGIGAELLGKVMDEAKALGYKTFRLHASDLGRSLYLRAGFVDSDGYMSLKL